MGTSLADQLRRLAVPQTSLLLQDKKRPSLLFDPKEAANLDRESFYELGLSGFEELKKLNVRFKEFEQTLFNISSVTHERSVQTSDSNRELHKRIKKFLLLLSPYFLLKPAHKALEWLINRFHIHSFNVDDLVLLILPYHETPMFVRCIQLVDVSDQTSRWHWLHSLQKPGATLTKRVLLRHASRDVALLKAICDTTLAAVKAYKGEAGALSTQYAFYCTTLVGALENSRTVTELQITHLMKSMLKGLSSPIDEFCAASLMITAQIARRAQLSQPLLYSIINIVVKNNVASLSGERMLLLVVLYQTQSLSETPGNAVLCLSRQPHRLAALADLATGGVEVAQLVVPLLAGVLKAVQEKADEREALEEFAVDIVSGISLDAADAELVIRCVLNAFDVTVEQSPSTVSWFASLLSRLERRYPASFDSVVAATLAAPALSAPHRSALTALLGFSVDTHVGIANVFTRLQHASDEIRAEAVGYVAQHHALLTEKDRKLLSTALMARLQDDSSLVVGEVLKFPSDVLLEMFGKDVLHTQLVALLEKCWVLGGLWTSVAASAFDCIGATIVGSASHVETCVFVALFPYLLPLNDSESRLADRILTSTLGMRNGFMSAMREMTGSGANAAQICAAVFKVLRAGHTLLPAHAEIFEVLKTGEESRNPLITFLTTLLLSYALPQGITPEESNAMLTTLLAHADKCGMRYVQGCSVIDSKTISLCLLPDPTTGLYHFPIQGLLHCLTQFIDRTALRRDTCSSSWWLVAEVEETSRQTQFLTRVFACLVSGCVTKKRTQAAYAVVLKTFLQRYFHDSRSWVKFLCNVGVKKSDDVVTFELQIRSLQLLAALLTKSPGEFDWCLDYGERTVVPALLVALSSAHAPIRLSALNCVEALVPRAQPTAPGYAHILAQLLDRREELKLDADQMSLAMYTSLSPDPAVQSLVKTSRQPFMERTLDSLLECIVHPTTPCLVSASLLSTLQHVNSSRILLKLVPYAQRLLSRGETTAALDCDETDVLQKIVSRLDDETVGCLRTEECWAMLERAMRDQRTVTHGGGCPAVMAMDGITREMFDGMGEGLQGRAVSVVVGVCADTDKPAVVAAAGRMVKRIAMDAGIVVGHLEAMRDARDPEVAGAAGARARKIQRFLNTAPSVALLQTPAWRRGITLLEFIQNKKKMQSVSVLLPLLFSLLKKCLQFEEQAPVEYTKQLVLSCLLHCCQKLSPSGGAVVLPPGVAVDAELVVQCVRATQNPQTHHHALLVLAHVAGMAPEQVLHNVMAVFTFMGSSVLRQDDAYSFQVIAKIVDTVVPILVRAGDASGPSAELSVAVSSVLRVFVDALLDIPEHRRLPLFHKLLVTLDEQRSLWLLLGLVLETHVVRGTTDGSVDSRVDFALQISQKFSPYTVIHSCVNLLQYALVLPSEKQAYKPPTTPSASVYAGLFDVERHTEKQLRHFKYLLSTFLSSLLASPQFVAQVAALGDDESGRMEPLYRRCIELLLTYIQTVSRETEVSVAKPTAKYWRVMQNQAYDLLDRVNALLPTEMFLLVVQGLFDHAMLPVRRKSMELLNSRLHHQAEFLAACDLEAVFKVVPHLVKVVETIRSVNSPSTELELNQQTALLSLKLLAHRLAAEHPSRFQPLLPLVSALLTDGCLAHGNLMASVALCLAELCATLRAHAIGSLASFMPALTDMLAAVEKQASPDMVALSIVTAVDKVVEALPRFLSPYLRSLLMHVSALSARWRSLGDSARATPLLAKLKATRHRLSTTVQPRVLIPAVGKCYVDMLEHRDFAALGPLLGILSDSFSAMDSSDLNQLQPDLIAFFQSALTLRSDSDLDLDAVDEAEGHVVNALVGLVLKLSETTFRPLYYSLFHWATEAGASKDRAITFYRLSSNIAKSLKGLFVLFAGHFLKNAASLLASNAGPADLHFHSDPRLIAERKGSLLVCHIIETLSLVFLYDSINFVNKERFETLMQPVVDQLENSLGGWDAMQHRAKTLVSPCIAQFAVAVADDVLWKQLNYQVLMKARHNQPQVRLAALESLCCMARKLGEDFLPLLPETIPFLAELLEDEEEVIERAAQTALQDLEQVLGEPLNKYF